MFRSVTRDPAAPSLRIPLSILSVPSTPLIVLDENGEVFTQELGFHGPDKLREIFSEATA